jgi:hypothetical protein
MPRSTIWRFTVGVPDTDDPKKTVTKKRIVEMVGGNPSADFVRDHVLQLHHPNAKWMSVPERVTSEDLFKEKRGQNPVRQELLRRMPTAEGREERAKIPVGPRGGKVDEETLEDIHQEAGPDSDVTIPHVPTEPEGSDAT